MNALSINATGPRTDLDGTILGGLRPAEPRFLAVALLMLAATLPTGFAALADARLFQGTDVWLKPLKFQLALAVWFVTFAFFARYLPAGLGSRRWYRIYSGVVVTAASLEMIWIAGAAILGTASHFNRSPVGGVLYSVAGLGAVILTTPAAVYAWQIGRNARTGMPPVLKEAVVMGLALVLPLTLMTAGTMSAMAGHEVGGVAGDARALAIFGWSRDGGDLRVAHFFATHAMHILPLAGLASWVLFGASRVAPVRLAALAFVGFVAAVFLQALAGQPFLPGLG